jgi:hypothetical protein
MPGDVGDRDDEVPAAGVRRIGIGFGPYRIVEIARIGAVDRDEAEVSQVAAAGGLGGLRGCGLGQRLVRKLVRDSKAGNRYQADRPGGVRRAQPLDNPKARRAITAGGQRLAGDQLAVGGTPGMRGIDNVLGTIAAVGGDDLPAIMSAMKNADDSTRGCGISRLAA